MRRKIIFLAALALLLGESPGYAGVFQRGKAWQGDQESIPVLRALKTTDPANSPLIDWALNTIAQLHLPQKDVAPNVP